MTRVIWPVVAVLVLCAGCAAPLQEPLSPHFGVAVASFDAQILPADPNPAPPSSSGAVGAAAIARSQSGQVIEPAASGTSQIAKGLASQASPPANPGVHP